MEIWDIYDNNRLKTGKTHKRGKKLGDGEYILIVMILIFDNQGRMLLQQRPKNVNWAPNKWTMTAGGAAIAGETSTQAASRELYEELGLQINFEGKRPNFSLCNNLSFTDYYIVRSGVDLSLLSVPNEEVVAIKWASMGDMIKMIECEECVPYRKSFVEYCFDVALNPILDSALTK